MAFKYAPSTSNVLIILISRTAFAKSNLTVAGRAMKSLFAEAVLKMRIIRKFDVKGAYLETDINEVICMMLPIKHRNEISQYVEN